MIDGRRVDVARNWSAALQTYRRALLAYRQLLEMRAERGLPRAPATVAASPAVPPVTPASHLEALTAREREVAILIARGASNQQIADTLVLTRGTVANHVAHILAKLGAINRTQVAARVLEGSPSPALDDSAASGPVLVRTRPTLLVSQPPSSRVATNAGD